MTIQIIPLNRLVPSSANVRKTGGSAGLDELAASIEAHGLLQNLQVCPAAKGKFEVVAGGRRLAAMKLLVRGKKLAKDFPVPCQIIGEHEAEEISLAENVVRLAMHPADQFEAFQRLTEQDKGVEEIAARFGVSPIVVRQRLKLASVSPVLIGLYRDEEMTLDQLMAFTVSEDHAAQEAAWFERPDWQRQPHAIRAALTEAQVEADDRRVRFVGLDAYLAAGGGIVRDLFQDEHQGYLTDPALLDRLVAEKLTVITASVAAEGWAWVSAMPVRDHAALSGFGRVRPAPQPLDAAAQAHKESLMAEYDGLIAEHGDEPDAEIADQLDALWRKIEAIDEAALAWSAEDKAIAGAMISLSHEGEAQIDRGIVRPDDARSLHQTAQSLGGGKVKVPGLSASLIADLTAERTAALRALMIDNHKAALAALCHALALQVFYGPRASGDTCLALQLTERRLTCAEDSRAQTALAERRKAWERRLPEESGDLFGWLLQQEQSVLIELLAFCAAQSVDAVRSKHDAATQPRLVHADALGAALDLDMRDWWSPTKGRYLSRVPKALVLEAVREGVSAQAAENLATLKKEALVEAAERRLAGSDWLPDLLRPATAPGSEAVIEAMAAE